MGLDYRTWYELTKWGKTSQMIKLILVLVTIFPINRDLDYKTNFYYRANFVDIYCEDINEQGCVHRDQYDWIFFCNGFICDEHTGDQIPEDCTIASIENNKCRYGILNDS